MKLYLASPVSAILDGDIQEDILETSESLERNGHEVFCPYKEALLWMKRADEEGHQNYINYLYQNILTSDVVIFYDLLPINSSGSIFEAGMAYGLQKITMRFGRRESTSFNVGVMVQKSLMFDVETIEDLVGILNYLSYLKTELSGRRKNELS